MLKIIKNPNETIYNSVTIAVKNNDGHCPCMIHKSSDTKCPCRTFREQTTEGECHCGRYVKIDVKKSVAIH